MFPKFVITTTRYCTGSPDIFKAAPGVGAKSNPVTDRYFDVWYISPYPSPPMVTVVVDVLYPVPLLLNDG